MKCPKCKKEVLIRKEQVATDDAGNPVYNQFAVCMDCRKKWNLDKIRAKQQQKAVSNAVKKAPISESPQQTNTTASIQTSSTGPIAKEDSEVASNVDNFFVDDREVFTEEELHQQVRGPHKTSPKSQDTYYGNIPPEEIRRQREEEMRRNYHQMLSVEEEDDDYDEDYEDEPSSKAPIIILVILIILALGASCTLLYCQKTGRSIPFLSAQQSITQEESTSQQVLVSDEEEVNATIA